MYFNLVKKLVNTKLCKIFARQMFNMTKKKIALIVAYNYLFIQ